ncbi:MAG TPA: DUF4389 domain-containing protein [Candidatus Limnocylindrales bacterium]
MTASSPTYPTNLRFDRDQPVSRLWGIPILGIAVRALLLLPHYFVLWLYSMLVGLTLLIVWVPVLATGRYPEWGYRIVGGYYRWSLRVTAYQLMMVAPYPPFSSLPGYPVEVDFDRSLTIDRLWGIPLLGMLARVFLAIPHAIVLWAVGMLVGFVGFWLWVPILLFGRFPQLGYELIGGYMRWQFRVTAWLLLIPAPYPPFRLAE